jgi:uncharacterized protein (DUF779 family)
MRSRGKVSIMPVAETIVADYDPVLFHRSGGAFVASVDAK